MVMGRAIETFSPYFRRLLLTIYLFFSTVSMFNTARETAQHITLREWLVFSCSGARCFVCKLITRTIPGTTSLLCSPSIVYGAVKDHTSHFFSLSEKIMMVSTSGAMSFPFPIVAKRFDYFDKPRVV
jgi:hypothetical protein